MTTSKLPFALTKSTNFYQELNNWIGDVFYDILPEKGFELRDEQIFMAFQLEQAFKDKKVMFAEAGVGTGKTLVYLLFAISHARYTGKPAIIACADETLIEQLVKKEGDIAKIREHLNLQIDARLSKSHDQYLCLKKLEKTMQLSDEEKWLDLYESLPSFVHESSAMQAFYPYGDRKDYHELSDAEWAKVGYDSFQDCLTCDMRHRCGLTLSRDHYRKSTDLIICSHDFYMQHIWTEESRKREGQLPLLPDHSSVVFDEGHLLEYAAQKALTYRVKQGTLEMFLERLLQNDIREEFAELIEETLLENDRFFAKLRKHSETIAGSDRMQILQMEELKTEAFSLYKKLEQIGEALVFEGELYTIDHYALTVVEEYIEQMAHSLSLFHEDAISWVESKDGDTTLTIMPKTVSEVLGERVFSKNIPFIFSSATLSETGSFDYMAKSLGIKDFISFTVDSPYDYEEQMKITIERMPESNHPNEMKAVEVVNRIKEYEGKTLVLFPTFEELMTFKKQQIEHQFDFPIYFEGDEEISTLVKKFQTEQASVLCTVHLWEGLDIPGASLEHVVIWSLPFPPFDPVFESKRNGAENAYQEVDLPYMLLRLRQGIGRLIRSSEDTGTIDIFIGTEQETNVLPEVERVLPVKPAAS
ncbi:MULTISPECIES: ATP-dependent DNA helicase [Bacillus]|uniref:ATP-dependent helicase n=2 Tax=Bacillus TaxID=1386 RepID=A0A0M4FQD6_9BACI|nr:MULTISPECIES: ATP-dependent DNA helicase [Bacillus]ALC81371.1 ATP-dependent helicase [Bacillus gobiensis]MBP1080393.1 ATP-dependent DNA helicase DinG [Bacillus capparidis]MED1094252.1 ATP-dependent DNA helicase [Bacillus capparidis]